MSSVVPDWLQALMPSHPQDPAPEVYGPPAPKPVTGVPAHADSAPGLRQMMGTMRGGGWPALRSQLADAGDALAVPMRALAGYPEKLAGITEGGGLAVNSPGSGRPAVTAPDWVHGAFDLAGLMPVLGEAGRATVDGMPFYSQLAKILEEKAPARATAKQFLDIATKGARAEELEWTGLGDLLRSDPSAKLDKVDVLKQVEENTPDLRERMISDNLPTAADYDKAWNTNGILPQKPQFTQYTLPGGTNQRELVVTLPPKEPIENVAPLLDENGNPEITNGRFSVPSNVYAVPSGHAYGDPDLDVNRLMHMRMNDRQLPLDPSIGERIRQVVGAKSEDSLASGAPGAAVRAGVVTPEEAAAYSRARGFRNDEADQFPNAGKALHLEELQSDWHQAGRESGYTGNENVPNDLRIKKIETEDEAQSILNDYGKSFDGVNPPSIGDWVLADANDEPLDIARGSLQLHEAVNEFRNNAPEGAWQTHNGVPDAPFKKTWHELGMKRMLQEAADGGYDRLTWTTGGQQLDRYSLSHHVDSLTYNPVTETLTGTKGPGNYTVFNKVVPKGELPDYVGRDVADKLTDQSNVVARQLTDDEKMHWASFKSDDPPVYGVFRNDKLDPTTATTSQKMAEYYRDMGVPNTISGDDLQVGGQGMRGFYDKMLPDFMNRYTRRWGGRVEDANIGSGPLVGKNTENLLNDLQEERREILEDRQELESQGRIEESNALAPRHNQLNARIKSIQDEIKNQTVKVHSVKITDLMREALKKGQPLFAAAPAAALPMWELTKKQDPQQ